MEAVYFSFICRNTRYYWTNCLPFIYIWIVVAHSSMKIMYYWHCSCWNHTLGYLNVVWLGLAYIGLHDLTPSGQTGAYVMVMVMVVVGREWRVEREWERTMSGESEWKGRRKRVEREWMGRSGRKVCMYRELGVENGMESLGEMSGERG